MSFHGNHQVRTNIIIEKEIWQHARHSYELGCDILYDSDRDKHRKVVRYLTMYGNKPR